MINKATVWKIDPQKDSEEFSLFVSSEEEGEKTLLSPIGEYWSDQDLTITRKITSNSMEIGILSVERSLSDVLSKTAQFQNFGFTSWVAIIFLILLITIWYQSSLTRPIQELLSVSEKISTEGHYNYRAKNIGGDEIGRLITQFNEMLDSLQESNKKLLVVNQEMEKRVQSRTKELTDTNEKLVLEMKQNERATKKLIQTQDKLNRQERLASVGQVSSNIAHELRNPMTAMRNSVYFLRSRSQNDPKTIQHLDLIDGELSQGDEVIERLLEITKGEKLRINETNIEKLCLDALQISDPLGLSQFEFIGDPIKKHINLDNLLFKQVFSNLFTNSLQAMTSKTKISVIVEVRSEVNIRVIDTGSGIPIDSWEEVFEPLITTKNDGIGLGLPLCKELVSRHEGKIQIESSSPTGTCILITIPLDLKPA